MAREKDQDLAVNMESLGEGFRNSYRSVMSLNKLSEQRNSLLSFKKKVFFTKESS